MLNVLKSTLVLPKLGLLALAVSVAAGAAVPQVEAAALVAAVSPAGHVQVTCGGGNATPGINAAIAAASGVAGGGTVDFGPGTCHIGSSVHMMSNVTLNIPAGTTLLDSGGGLDGAEANSCGGFQDFGHSHFHDAMIWGNNLQNIGFVGAGTIDGGGHLSTGGGGGGAGDKIISLTHITNLTISGLTLRNGGHFAILVNDVDGLTSDHLDIETAGHRDGWNVINTRNAHITNLIDHANDDALVFKSDWALCQLPSWPNTNGNVTVDNANLSAGCCSALMFGSETCGNFTGYSFTNIHITGAGKSALGMVSSDGAQISNVVYDGITISGPNAGLIYEKVWDRHRCGVNRGVGSISDIHYRHITGATTSRRFSSTLWGFDMATHSISNVSFENDSLTVPGGEGGGSPNTLPSNGHDYNPRSIGARPAYGLFMHDVNGVTLTSTSFHGGAESLPAVDVITGAHVRLDTVTAAPSTGYHFNGVTGYCVVNSTGSVTAVGSTAGC